jgi:hypothetical protein
MREGDKLLVDAQARQRESLLHGDGGASSRHGDKRNGAQTSSIRTEPEHKANCNTCNKTHTETVCFVFPPHHKASNPLQHIEKKKK